MSFNVEVDTSGPFFDPRVAHEIMQRYCRRVEDAIGDRGVTLIRVFLLEHYKYLRGEGPVPDNPGYYNSQIQTERQVDALLVRDDRVVYGPWLEGVGSRNYPVTRFRGYHAFRE